MKQPTVLKHGDHEYQIGHLDPFQQFHVGRRLAPLLARLGTSWNQGEFNPVPIAQGLAEMQQEDANYILKTCLGVVSRKSTINNQEVWQPVQVRNGAAVMFDDLTGGDLLRISVQVIVENLGDFFPSAQL